MKISNSNEGFNSRDLAAGERQKYSTGKFQPFMFDNKTVAVFGESNYTFRPTGSSRLD